MPTYKTVYTVLSFLVVPILVYWAYLSIKNYRKYSYSKILLALSLVSLFYTIIYTIVEATMYAYMDSVTVIILPAFIVTVLTLVIIDLHEA